MNNYLLIIIIIMSKLSVFDNSSVDVLEMLKNLEFDQTCRHYAVKKIMVIAIRTFYYFFAEEISSFSPFAFLICCRSSGRL